MAPAWKTVLAACTLLATTVECSGPVVDLGYAVYRGAVDSSFGLNTFKGFDLPSKLALLSPLKKKGLTKVLTSYQ